MTILLGVYYVVQGLKGMFIVPSMSRLLEHVRMGTLDFVLVKPVNSQFMVSLRHMKAVQLAQAMTGVVVIGLRIHQRGASLGILDALAFSVALACGLVLVYALLLSLCTLSFWLVRVDNLLTLFWAFLDAGRFPVDIYPGWLRLTMSTIVPIGIAVTIPAEALAGRLQPLPLAAIVLAALFAATFSSWFWQRGLRASTGASA